MSEPLIFLSAGEASGERYGALLIEEMKRTEPGAQFFGLCGERMAALGCEAVARSEDVAVMGITEVIAHMPRIYAAFRRLKRAIRERRPQVAVLIDFPDVNLRLAEALSRQGVPVIYFVSPQLWAWKKRRIERVRRFVSRMLVIFPFEEQFYDERGVEAEFVGHPLAELPLPEVSRAEFASRWGLDAGKRWIGLLPGSRAREIGLNLPEMLSAARLLDDGRTEFVLPLAATLREADRRGTRAMVDEAGMAATVRVVDDARGALHHARASMVASGTATVEAALMGNPFVVVYRVSRLTYAIAQRVVTVPHVAMVNLVAERRVVPELIQDAFTAEAVVAALRPLLADGVERERMIEELGAVRARLRGDGNAIARLASHAIACSRHTTDAAPGGGSGASIESARTSAVCDETNRGKAAADGGKWV